MQAGTIVQNCIVSLPRLAPVQAGTRNVVIPVQWHAPSVRMMRKCTSFAPESAEKFLLEGAHTAKYACGWKTGASPSRFAERGVGIVVVCK